MSASSLFLRVSQSTRQFLANPYILALLLLSYAGVLLVIAAPVLATSVGADDSYWILQVAPDSNGSFWDAAWGPLRHAFDFDEVDSQPRTTALGTSERRVIALATIRTAVLLSVPPALVWALVKVALLALAVVAVGIFLYTYRFRGRGGMVGRFSGSTRAIVLLIFPLMLVIGVKAESVGTINGWLFYPSFTYGPFVICLLIASLAITSTRALDRRFVAFVAPVVMAMALIALALNLSYETHAVAVPITVLAVLLQPLPDGGSWWARWRGRFIVLGTFGGTFTILFLWIRWRISQMACHIDNSCYAGSVVEFDPRTLALNIIGALPGRNEALVSASAEAAGRSAGGVTSLSIALAVAALILAALIWASRSLRQSVKSLEDPVGARKGLLLVAAIALAIGVGGAMITGLSARAVEALAASSVVAYRTGVLTWSSFSLAISCVVVALMFSRAKVVRVVVVASVLVAFLLSVSVFFPRNVLSAQISRAEAGVAFIDTLHREISLGDLSKRGDERRCEGIETFLEGRERVSDRFVQSVSGAYDTFDFFYDVEYCSTGRGLDMQPRNP